MSIEVPKEFECPITFDVMINPVRANCVEEKPKEPTGIFSHFFTRGSDDSCSGHFFEGLAGMRSKRGRHNEGILAPSS